MRAGQKKAIDPEAKTLHLSEVAELFDLKPNTLRQNIRRGVMPSPIMA